MSHSLYNSKTAAHSLAALHTARWTEGFPVQAQGPQFKAPARLWNADSECTLNLSDMRGRSWRSPGLAGHQSSSRISPRPCLKGMMQGMIDQDSQHSPLASECCTYTCVQTPIIYTHGKEVYNKDTYKHLYIKYHRQVYKCSTAQSRLEFLLHLEISDLK